MEGEEEDEGHGDAGCDYSAGEEGRQPGARGADAVSELFRAQLGGGGDVTTLRRREGGGRSTLRPVRTKTAKRRLLATQSTRAAAAPAVDEGGGGGGGVGGAAPGAGKRRPRKRQDCEGGGSGAAGGEWEGAQTMLETRTNWRSIKATHRWRGEGGAAAAGSMAARSGD